MTTPLGMCGCGFCYMIDKAKLARSLLDMKEPDIRCAICSEKVEQYGKFTVKATMKVKI